MTATPLRIATRKSALALWQAERVRSLLAARGQEACLLPLSTQGDRILDRPLAEIGGKGLFVKEIEQALLEGRADLAVHSAKDVPYALPEGLTLCAYPAREDPRDALVSAGGLRFEDLPRGARVGTSSLRRALQLRALRPDLEIVSVRGNVQTRLSRAVGPVPGGSAAALGEPALQAVVLALAGLRRLGLESHVSEILEPELCLPAAGQGALAIEVCRGAASEPHCAGLDDAATSRCVRAERALLRALSGGCTVPIAAYATCDGGELRLRARLGGPTRGGGVTLLSAEARGTDPERLGETVAQELRQRGADELLAASAAQAPGLPPPKR